jgi:hypothetical protein
MAGRVLSALLVNRSLILGAGALLASSELGSCCCRAGATSATSSDVSRCVELAVCLPAAGVRPRLPVASVFFVAAPRLVAGVAERRLVAG